MLIELKRDDFWHVVESHRIQANRIFTAKSADDFNEFVKIRRRHAIDCENTSSGKKSRAARRRAKIVKRDVDTIERQAALRRKRPVWRLQ